MECISISSETVCHLLPDPNIRMALPVERAAKKSAAKAALVGDIADDGKCLRPGTSGLRVRRKSIATDAIALDPHAVADAQAVEAGLRDGLIGSVVESDANEIDVVSFVRLTDFVADLCATCCASNGSHVVAAP